MTGFTKILFALLIGMAVVYLLIAANPLLPSGGWFQHFFHEYPAYQTLYPGEAGVYMRMLVGNVLTAVACLMMPVVMYWIYYKRGREIPFKTTFTLFGLFLIACGIKRIWNVINMHYGMFSIESYSDLLTGILSVATLAVLVPVARAAILLPSPAQLKKSNQELAKLVRENEELRLAYSRLQANLRDASHSSESSD